MRRFLIPLLAAALLAIVVSGCAMFKTGSFLATQPSEIGNVRLHLALCATGENLPPTGACEPNGSEGESQYLLVFAVPKGASAPATVKAVPGPGPFAIDYTRNQEVADRFAEMAGSEEKPWPPPGTELVGYLSNAVSEQKAPEGEGSWEWTIDADFGLPPAADGGSYGGPFVTAVGTGWRTVSETRPADRPLNCSEAEPPLPPPAPPFPIPTTTCLINEEATLGVSDLKISSPSTATAVAGGTATIPFSLDFASSVTPPPSFALTAATNLAGAAATLAEPTFAAPSVDSTTHRAPLATRAATVTVPPNAAPGTYDVTLVATAPSGGMVSAVGKLTVQAATPRPGKAKLTLGKAKLNKAKGTATLPITFSPAGTLTVSGKGVATVKRQPKSARTLKLKIRAKGKAKAELLKSGRAKLRVKVRFTPQSGAAVIGTRSITLQKLS